MHLRHQRQRAQALVPVRAAAGRPERRQVRLTYATASRGGEVKERIVEPYTIIPYGRSWQMIAFCHLRTAVIQFKVDRVRSASLLDQNYVIPSDFDLAAYQGDAWGTMRGPEYPAEDVALLFEPEAGRWVAEESWHRSQQVEVQPDGCVEVRFHVGVTPEMVNWLMYYGARVTVLAPEWLRERVREEHTRAVECAKPKEER